MCLQTIHPLHRNLIFLFKKTFLFNPIGTDDEDHEYDYLGAWGPRFDKLDKMYGPEPGQEIDEL